MTPDEIKALVENEYPDLRTAPRRNPTGWAFFLHEICRGPRSTRIARVVRASHRSVTLFKPAVSARLGLPGAEETEITRGEAQLRRLLDRELERYRQHLDNSA